MLFRGSEKKCLEKNVSRQILTASPSFGVGVLTSYHTPSKPYHTPSKVHLAPRPRNHAPAERWNRCSPWLSSIPAARGWTERARTLKRDRETLCCRGGERRRFSAWMLLHRSSTCRKSKRPNDWASRSQRSRWSVASSGCADGRSAESAKQAPMGRERRGRSKKPRKKPSTTTTTSSARLRGVSGCCVRLARSRRLGVALQAQGVCRGRQPQKQEV